MEGSTAKELRKVTINDGKWVTGKKSYRCEHCERVIPKGERHWADHNFAENTGHPDHFCTECATRFDEILDFTTEPYTTELIAWASPEKSE